MVIVFETKFLLYIMHYILPYIMYYILFILLFVILLSFSYLVIFLFLVMIYGLKPKRSYLIVKKSQLSICQSKLPHDLVDLTQQSERILQEIL